MWSSVLTLCKPSDAHELRFRSRPQLRRDSADKPRIEPEPAKNGAYFPESNGRPFVNLQVNEIMIAIDLVAQASDGFEFVIQFQYFVQIANAGGVNFKFNHVAAEA
jgi:hypothetical protein